MAIQFHILKAGGAFTGATFSALSAALAKTARDCSKKLKLGDVDVVVMNVPYNTIPRLGINGYSYDPHQIVLFLDIEHPQLRQNLRGRIRSIMAHELHHCARAAARGSSHSTTYGGSLVAEGLACCFEEEMGEPTPFYAVECAGPALTTFAARAQEHVSSDRSEIPGSWQQWMFGDASASSEFPYQCGYSLGYALVKDWLVTHGLNSSDAVDADESLILDPWIDGKVDPFRS